MAIQTTFSVQTDLLVSELWLPCEMEVSRARSLSDGLMSPDSSVQFESQKQYKCISLAQYQSEDTVKQLLVPGPFNQFQADYWESLLISHAKYFSKISFLTCTAKTLEQY